ncbi:MAG: hypothetical protein LUF04_15980 [Bacteroides sp.]|nr:hypothetical protein [Bacteroides sp.]
MNETVGIPTEPEGRIELAINLLGKTRREMVPEMRRRGVLYICDDLDLTVPGVAMSNVSFQLDRWISVMAGFARSRKKEMRSCCTSQLCFEDKELAKPYLKWIKSQGESTRKNCWQIPDRFLTIEMATYAFQVALSFSCYAPEFLKKIQPLHRDTFHY